MTDMISREGAIAVATSCPDSHWGPWIAERLRALPAAQPDAAAIRKAARDKIMSLIVAEQQELLAAYDVPPEVMDDPYRRECVEALTDAILSARVLPAARADAAAIREAALRDALGAAAAETDRLRAAKKKHAHRSDIKGDAMAEGAFRATCAVSGLHWRAREEAALCEMARLGQEFDAAIFSDVERLYEDGEPGKEVMPDVRHYQDTVHDTAPAGLSAGGGAGWQPIETAPRDGSRFLGYWPSSGRDGDFAITTWWDAFDGFWESPFESADYDADYGPTGWRPHPPATEGGDT